MKTVRIKMRDDDLATNRLRGVGFRGVSSSGWEGPVRIFRADAVRDVRNYRAHLPQAALTGEAAYSTKRAGASNSG